MGVNDEEEQKYEKGNRQPKDKKKIEHKNYAEELLPPD